MKKGFKVKNKQSVFLIIYFVFLIMILSLFQVYTQVPIRNINIALNNNNKSNRNSNNYSSLESSKLISKSNKFNNKINTSSNNKLINSIPGSELTSLNIEAGKYDEASFRFGCLNDFFSFTYRGKSNDLVLSHLKQPMINFNKENEIMVFSDNLKAENSFTFKGSYKIRAVKQWILLYEETFSDIITDWNYTKTSECGGVVMLGGYGNLGSQQIYKKFENLPVHESIRIQVNYHFIDAWDNETGYLMVDIGAQGGFEYLWIDRYSAFVGNNGINVCGGKWPEGKFSVPIDVTFPHKGSTTTIKFGSTIEQDAYNQSYGISNLRIYFR